MEALIRFWLNMGPFTLTDQDRETLNEGFSSWTAKNIWMEKNCARIGLPKDVGFLHWNKANQALYVQEGNGRKSCYFPGGFQTPSYLQDPAKYPIVAVTAVVYFESFAGIKTGEYDVVVSLEKKEISVKVVLSFETLDDGVVRYTLHIGRCPNLEVLSRVASLIRSGSQLPTVNWP